MGPWIGYGWSELGGALHISAHELFHAVRTVSGHLLEIQRHDERAKARLLYVGFQEVYAQ